MKWSRARTKRTGFARSIVRREYDMRRLARLTAFIEMYIYGSTNANRVRLEYTFNSSRLRQPLRKVIHLLAFAQTRKYYFSLLFGSAYGLKSFGVLRVLTSLSGIGLFKPLLSGQPDPIQ